MYLGCRGCCAKLRWLIFIIAALAAVACLVAGLIKSIPELITLFKCTTQENSIQDSGVCWKTFWSVAGVPFVVACIGLGALLLALTTCCCFCCAKSPVAKAKQEQFASGDGGYDTAPHGDQYNYGSPVETTKPSVAHV
ncbi:MAG: hypothetical protein J3K34DRAFT_423543 [Monoraphidium minutum]|nr:MAG: hypothetical protein J3K34DRAFT_423543 [Monoraphidium minutum]